MIEFGGKTDFLSYMLVSSIVTRRIHERWREEKEKASADGRLGHQPQLMITLEEAHKFLSPEAAHQTIFGTIAREMRKYNVTLLVVDQRPSSIADEVMSQIGTRVTCLLDDEKDIGAVLGGIPNGNALRSVLAKLDTKQQAILLGHAVPMPVVIRTRDYGSSASYAELTRDRRARRPPAAPTDSPEAANGHEPAHDPVKALKEIEDLLDR